MLQDLGLEPTNRDVAALVATLGSGRPALVSKPALLAFVRSGGRPGALVAAGGGAGSGDVSDAARRNDSLYRVYSIESYTLANALSELAASTLPPGARTGATLKELAAAAAVLPPPEPIGGSSSSAASVAGTVATTADHESHLLRSSSAHTDSSETPSTLQLPDAGSSASPEVGEAPTLKTWAKTSGSEVEVAANGTATIISAAVNQAGRQHRSSGSGSGGMLGWLAGSSLRATPGALGQYGTLLSRALVKFARCWPSKTTDVMLLVFAGIVCGEWKRGKGRHMPLAARAWQGSWGGGSNWSPAVASSQLTLQPCLCLPAPQAACTARSGMLGTCGATPR